MFGEPITHGSWLRHAIDHAYVDPIGLCRSAFAALGYAADDFNWIAGLGARVIPVEKCLAPLGRPGDG